MTDNAQDKRDELEKENERGNLTPGQKAELESLRHQSTVKPLTQ